MPAQRPRPIVLLVEDSDDDVFFFRHTLKKSGAVCSLVHVGDGAAAINYLKEASTGNSADHPWPDLVFLDLKLPAFSGFEILAWVREQQLDGRLDVAILSGSEHASDVERAKALGATGYFVKPVSLEQFRERLSRWSEQHTPASAAAEGSSGRA